MADEKDTRIAELERQLADANKVNESQAKDLEQASKVVVDLKTQLAEKPAASAPDSHGQVTVGDTTYDLTVKAFHYGGKIVDLDTLKDDTKLVKELLKEGVSFLRKVAK